MSQISEDVLKRAELLADDNFIGEASEMLLKLVAGYRFIDEARIGWMNGRHNALVELQAMTKRAEAAEKRAEAAEATIAALRRIANGVLDAGVEGAS